MNRASLDERHRKRQAIIADVVAARLGAMLAGMEELTEEQLAAYVERAYPTVAGGQLVAADTAAAYATVLAAGRKPKRPLNVGGALASSGKLVEPTSRSLVAPVLRARHLVATGKTPAAAIVKAASYADQLASADLQAAMRVGVGEGAAAAGFDSGGWAKDAGPDACSWCQEMTDVVYGDPDDVPFHDGDRCGVAPAEESTPAVFDDSDIPF